MLVPQTKEYLAQTPCTLQVSNIDYFFFYVLFCCILLSQSEELIKQVLSALSKYELTKCVKFIICVP